MFGTPPTRISKNYTFEAAHQLPGHAGKCRNLHGHGYKVTVWVKGKVQTLALPDQGMVVDYGNLDDIVKPQIEAMDHCFLSPALDDPIRLFVLQQGWKVYDLMERTTAENISFHIWTYVAGELVARGLADDIPLLGVTIKETDKTDAEFIATIGKVRSLGGSAAEAA